MRIEKYKPEGLPETIHEITEETTSYIGACLSSEHYQIREINKETHIEYLRLINTIEIANILNKVINKTELTPKELRFIYTIDRSIPYLPMQTEEGLSAVHDAHQTILQSREDKIGDITSVTNLQPEEIATQIEDITEHTKIFLPTTEEGYVTTATNDPFLLIPKIFIDSQTEDDKLSIPNIQTYQKIIEKFYSNRKQRRNKNKPPKTEYILTKKEVELIYSDWTKDELYWYGEIFPNQVRNIAKQNIQRNISILLGKPSEKEKAKDGNFLHLISPDLDLVYPEDKYRNKIVNITHNNRPPFYDIAPNSYEITQNELANLTPYETELILKDIQDNFRRSTFRNDKLLKILLLPSNSELEIASKDRISLLKWRKELLKDVNIPEALGKLMKTHYESDRVATKIEYIDRYTQLLYLIDEEKDNKISFSIIEDNSDNISIQNLLKYKEAQKTYYTKLRHNKSRNYLSEEAIRFLLTTPWKEDEIVWLDKHFKAPLRKLITKNLEHNLCIYFGIPKGSLSKLDKYFEIDTTKKEFPYFEIRDKERYEVFDISQEEASMGQPRKTSEIQERIRKKLKDFNKVNGKTNGNGNLNPIASKTFSQAYEEWKQNPSGPTAARIMQIPEFKFEKKREA